MNGRRRGFALLSVLWCVGLLAIIATAMIRAAHYDGQRLRVDIALARAQAAADGAARLAILHALRPGPKPSWDGTPRREGDALVAVQDEAGLVDCNGAAPELLAGLLLQAGTGAGMAESLSAAILATRKTPFLSPFQIVRTPGMTASLASALLPLLTVFSGAAGIDPRTAPPAVLAVLPQMDRERVAAVTNARAASPMADLRPLLLDQRRFLAESSHDGIRITATASVDGVSAQRIADVRLMPDGRPPYAILSWMTEYGG